MFMLHSAGDKDQTPGLAAVGARKSWWLLRGMRREAGDGDQDGDKDGTEGAGAGGEVRFARSAKDCLHCIPSPYPVPVLGFRRSHRLVLKFSTSEFRSRCK